MIKYFLKNPEFTLARATDGASGYDLIADTREPLILSAGARTLIPTGLHLEMPVGIEAQVRSRSGLAINHGVIVLNAPGTVDSDYRGEIKVTLLNTGSYVLVNDPMSHVIKSGDRIAQLVFAPVLLPNMNEELLYAMATAAYEPRRVLALGELGSTSRGVGGHGSTGR